VDKNPPVSWILTHIFNSLKIDPFDLMFWSRCSRWSCLLDWSLQSSLHCVVDERFAILKKILGLLSAVPAIGYHPAPSPAHLLYKGAIFLLHPVVHTMQLCLLPPRMLL